MSFYLENPPKQFTAMCLTENIASLFIYLFVYLFVQYLNIYLFINLFIYIYIYHTSMLPREPKAEECLSSRFEIGEHSLPSKIS